MKAACIILSTTIFLAIMAVCVMVKFATDITVEERKREYGLQGGGVYQFTKAMGVITLHDNTSFPIAERFPYVAAVTRNSSTLWSFACFASVVLIKWVVTSAHCSNTSKSENSGRLTAIDSHSFKWGPKLKTAGKIRPGATHRILLFQDFARNYTHTYPVLFWRLHEKFNISNPTPKYDIAVAKLNVDVYPFSIKPSIFDEKPAKQVEAAVWKTVSTMNKQLYLTNDFETIVVKLAAYERCFEAYGVELDESLICVDLSDYDDCFIHEFGPIYSVDKIVGILAVKPRDCDTKLAIFTNISYYTNWILKSTHTTYYG